MERQRKVRKITRSNITKVQNKIHEELGKAVPERHNILMFREEINRLAGLIDEQDRAILNEMIDEDAADEILDIENEEINVYRNKITLSEIKIEDYIKSFEQFVNSDGRSQLGSYHTVIQTNQDIGRSKKTYKLPKIEIKKFNGQLLEWLSFWSQFEKIHKDEDLHATDKFQYLSQAMVEGTRAKELVNSYPQTSDNYPKVIEALTERFGKRKILKQVYVRELIKMIAANVNGKTKIVLTKLFDNLESHIRALESLGVTQEQTSEFLFPLVESSLPDEILIAWQRSPNFGKDGANENPPKNELYFLMQFLKQEVESEQQRSLARADFLSISNKPQEMDNYNTNKQSREKASIPTAASLYIGSSNSCIFCEKTHPSQECAKAMGMSLEAKRKVLKDKKVCPRCLKSHGIQRCKIWVNCSGCAKPHYHLMCPESPRNLEQKGNHCNSIVVNSNQVIKQVLLKTILVKIKTKFGSKNVRILFDDGSQQSYIKTSIATDIKCVTNGKYFERNTLFGGVLSNIEERTIYKVQLLSMNGKTKRNIELPDKKQITGKILKMKEGPWLDELKSKGIYINDQESTNEDIDILIGADLCPLLTLDESITLKCGLKAVKTVFGWTIMGPITIPQNNVILSHSMLVTLAQQDERNIKDLWDLELIGIRDPITIKSKEERDHLAEMHFKQTVSRNEDGRYRVQLPWIDGSREIPNNFGISHKRLLNATKKLKKDDVYHLYDKIFQEWEKEGFIEEVLIQNEDLFYKKRCHFIPHHPIFKPESKTTPVRPVFDASCKIGRHPSLNECLEKGINLIELITIIMLRFREGKYGVISDIRKAFQMIQLQEPDQDYLLFLWWEDITCNKLKIFKHKRVVFGVKCSPFILGAVINYHLDNVVTEDKQIAQKLKNSLYVDNSVTSVDSIEEYYHFKDNATRILAGAKMELRQWEHSTMETPGIGLIQGVGLGVDSNCKDDDNFARSLLPKTTVKLEEEITSVLGMSWNKKTDTLSCATVPEVPEYLTKRTLLASINKIFDPLGFLSPAMVYPKLILQWSWDQKMDWDEALPIEAKEKFRKWCNELYCLKEIEIPRNMKGDDFSQDKSNIQLHVFNDASQIAYATVIFMRVETEQKVSVQLLQAKARIAPISKLTIPRLELMSCVIGARLMKTIHKTLFKQFPCFYWTDSSTTLAWIQRNDEWGTFVGNRVREILQLSDMENWHHIPGKYNPADLPSRGCSPKNLLTSRWWEGPEWLKLPQSQWPIEEYLIDEEIVNNEKKKTKVIKNVVSNVPLLVKNPWYAEKSSYVACLRGIAWIKRFINNCLAKKRNAIRYTGLLSMVEINEAETSMVKMVQMQVFPVGANYITGLRVSQDKAHDIYYVTTKILNRSDTGRFRKPLLLPQIHPMVDKMIMEEHIRYGHAGTQFLIGKLREKFWIIKTRLAVSRVIKTCITCKRYTSKAPTVPISALPEHRVKNAKVFEVSGIDMAGPLHLRNGDKIWVIIFTCAVLRAVHLESVEKINSEEFILALSRFIYRKGRPSIIYADNGTNFVGTANLVGKLNWNKIQTSSKLPRIQWIFIPPASPWWGGFWERLIRTMKEYLRKILGHNKLNKVELDTTLCFVEHLMNDRPLTYISEDQDDLIPLTPAAFLRDIIGSEFPEIEVLNDKKLRTKHRDLVQLKEELRERFRKEYLGLLVQRKKPTEDRKFEVGEIVLVASDDKKRLEWPMARILELIPGTDNEVRVARVKTSDGKLVRSLQRLFPLEINSSTEPLPVTPVVKSRAKNLQLLDNVSNDVVGENESKSPVEVTTRYGRKIKKPLRFRF